MVGTALPAAGDPNVTLMYIMFAAFLVLGLLLTMRDFFETR